MSASLVGSEMCIRDRLQQPLDQPHVGRMTLTPSRGHAIRIGITEHVALAHDAIPNLSHGAVSPDCPD
eukprot:2489923-Alexandrium_andersonii.AAC.1